MPFALPFIYVCRIGHSRSSARRFISRHSHLSRPRASGPPTGHWALCTSALDPSWWTFSRRIQVGLPSRSAGRTYTTTVNVRTRDEAGYEPYDETNEEQGYSGVDKLPGMNDPHYGHLDWSTGPTKVHEIVELQDDLMQTTDCSTTSVDDVRRPVHSLQRALKVAAKKGLGPDVTNIKLDPYSQFLGSLQRRTDFAFSKVLNVLRVSRAGRKGEEIDRIGLDECLGRVISTQIRIWTSRSDYKRHTTAPSLRSEAVFLKRSDIDVLQGHGIPEESVRLSVAALLTHDSNEAVQLAIRSLTRSNSQDFTLLLLDSLLIRRRLTHEAVRLLLGTLEDLASTSEYDSIITNNGTSNRSSSNLEEVLPRWLTIYAIFTKVTRHALSIWPESLEMVAYLWTQLMVHSRSLPSEGSSHSAVLTFFHNRFIFLLSEPSNIEPRKSVKYQASAQNEVLKFMALSQPAISINLDGYRGVLRVQLGQKKTSMEQEWARLKSESWPPWKEDRTGLDALITPEHGVSQAGRVLRRMQEAGYPMTTWEKTASILAGWDTDQTPTIQVRSLVPYMRKASGDPPVWAARIKSTRTLKEAWACFLAHADSGNKPDPQIYLAMFEKVITKQRRSVANVEQIRNDSQSRTSQETIDTSIVYPGDVPDTFPGPRSAHQEIYTRTEPPNAHELFTLMESQKIRPRNTLLLFLMKESPSWDLGWRCFRSAMEDLPHGTRNSLDFFSLQESKYGNKDHLTAFLYLILRFPTEIRAELDLKRYQYHSEGVSLNGWILDKSQPLTLAWTLLLESQTINIRSWAAFLNALAVIRPGFTWIHRNTSGDLWGVELESFNEHVNVLIAYQLARDGLDLMTSLHVPIDKLIFHSLCTIVYRAANAASELLEDGGLFDEIDIEASPPLHKLIQEAKSIQPESGFIRQMFHQIVGSERTTSPDLEPDSKSLPRLNAVPNPAILHAYVRALGAVRDYRGILDLYVWMQKHWPELADRQAEDRSGKIMFRRVVFATRMYLQFGRDLARKRDLDPKQVFEDLEYADSNPDMDWWAAPADVVDGVRRIVDDMETEWGSWPIADDVLRYIHKGKVKRQEN